MRHDRRDQWARRSRVLLEAEVRYRSAGDWRMAGKAKALRRLAYNAWAGEIYAPRLTLVEYRASLPAIAELRAIADHAARVIDAHRSDAELRALLERKRQAEAQSDHEPAYQDDRSRFTVAAPEHGLMSFEAGKLMLVSFGAGGEPLLSAYPT
jgi:hypothetical protein